MAVISPKMYVASLQGIFDQYFTNRYSMSILMSNTFFNAYLSERNIHLKIADIDEELWTLTKCLLKTIDEIFNGNYSIQDTMNMLMNKIVSNIYHNRLRDKGSSFKKSRHYQHGYDRIVGDVLINFYYIRSLIFIQSSYWCDIQTIYKNWKYFNEKARQIEEIIFVNFQSAEKNIYKECITVSKGKNIKDSVYCMSPIPRSADYERAINERDDCLNTYKISKKIQTLVPFGFVHEMNKNNLYIPYCIKQIIYGYHGSLSFKERVKELIESAVNDTISFCECEEIEKCYSMISSFDDTSFYDVYNTKIVYILKQTLSKLSDEYVMNEMNLMEYTKQIEILIEISYHNYYLDILCEEIIIPSYVDTVYGKHNNDDSGYNKIVCELNKNELKRIYKLFNKVNKTEANRLNKSYKNKLKTKKRKND